MKISKELLSEVLNLEVVGHSLLNKQTNSINVQYMPDEDSLQPDWKPINIYELAHKCKEWACNDFGLNIFTEKHTFNLYEASIKICKFNNKLGNYNSFSSYYPKEKTEHEAIFKACEWILKEKK